MDDTVYRSIAEASRQLNRSSRSIRQYLDDPTKSNYKRLELYRPSYLDAAELNATKLIQLRCIDGHFFATTSCVVENGLAERTRQVRDRCRSKSKKWLNWSLVKRMSNDYPNRE